MTRILHISDLHFGFHREELVEPLLALINRANADLVVVTGDLTHRGRPGQFCEAARFLSRITAPVMAVPGNHDVPLYNIPIRFLLPWSGYRQAISSDLAPTRYAGSVRVLGLNSVDPFSWQRGRIGATRIDALIDSLDPLATNIVALHHPLQHMPGVDKQLAVHAGTALSRFEIAGARIVLSGHLHLWEAAALLDQGHAGILQIQAGTALCARRSDMQNEFAVIDVEDDDLCVERYIATMDEADFRAPQMMRFFRRNDLWHCADDGRSWAF